MRRDGKRKALIGTGLMLALATPAGPGWAASFGGGGSHIGAVTSAAISAAHGAVTTGTLAITGARSAPAIGAASLASSPAGQSSGGTIGATSASGAPGSVGASAAATASGATPSVRATTSSSGSGANGSSEAAASGSGAAASSGAAAGTGGSTAASGLPAPSLAAPASDPPAAAFLPSAVPAGAPAVATVGLAGSAAMTSLDVAATRAFLATPIAFRLPPERAVEPVVTVIAAFTGPDGRPCRRVQETVTIDRRTVRAWGDVCVARGGGWVLSPVARR